MSGTPRTYAGADAAAGRLLTVSQAHRAVLGEWVRIATPNQPVRRGQVIEVSRDATVVQVFEDTVGLAPAATAVTLTGDIARAVVGEELLGRVFAAPAPRSTDCRAPVGSARHAGLGAHRSIRSAAASPPTSSRPASRPSTG